MISLKQAQDIINKSIKNLKFDSNPAELYGPISYTLNLGGKRLRPALVLLSCNLFSEDYSPAINPALAFELLHNFTLVHDDIMDNANLRRGKPTVHSKWGNNIALLSGDTLLIKAFEYITKCNDKFLNEVVEVFTQAAIKVCEGQQFDMNFETAPNISEENYIKMIGLKTASLIASCLKTGAFAGGASKKDADLLYDFGLNLGLAFQLQDDYLDVFGEASSIGKEIGKDIISNKKTYLLIKALELAKGIVTKDLQNWISLKNFDPSEKINAIKDIYLHLKINELTLLAVENYFLKATICLEKINVPDSRKAVLHKFLHSLRNREN